MSKQILDNYNNNINIKNLFLNLLYRKEMRASRIFLVVSFFSSFILLFYSGIAFSCQLSLIQNLVIPFFIIQNAQPFYNLKNPYDKIKVGAIIGGIAGIIPATTINMVSAIQYYLLNNRIIAYSALGIDPPPISLEVLYTEVGSGVFIWFLLVFLSSISGVISSIITRKK